MRNFTSNILEREENSPGDINVSTNKSLRNFKCFGSSRTSLYED